MRFRWLLAIALGVAVGKPASAQVSLYAEFSASKLTGGLVTQTTDVLYGPTIGLTAGLHQGRRMNISGDVRGTFRGGSKRLDGIAVGPQISFPMHKFNPYAEALIGFARYNDGLGNINSGTTDGQMQLNFGIDRSVSKRFDWRVFEFGYQQYYALGGFYNPKTFSTGAVLHLGKR